MNEPEQENSNSPNNISHISNKVISKRVYWELTKSNIDEKEKELINSISQKVDVLIDIILNKNGDKFHYVQLFICNIVELNSELIRLLPEYKDSIPDNLNLRFIMPAKNIYNYAIEVYFSIHDLYNIDLNTFMEVFKHKYPFKFDDK
jgi:hypothetical protein